MIDIDSYIEQLTNQLKKRFDTRLLYVGLQGSYLRGEATENSDIDIMVIIDELSVSDLDHYRLTIQSIDNFDKSCGFICSRTDLKCWNPLEICHLIHTTKDYYGKLSNYTPDYTKQDIRNFIKLSVNNLYHEICHRYIHAKTNTEIHKLSGSYKSVFFILQSLHYLEKGEYVATKAELLTLLTGKNQVVLQRAIDLNQGYPYDFAESFELLFTWCQECLTSVL